MFENEGTLIFKNKCANLTKHENASHIPPENKLEIFEWSATSEHCLSIFLFVVQFLVYQTFWTTSTFNSFKVNITLLIMIWYCHDAMITNSISHGFIKYSLLTANLRLYRTAYYSTQCWFCKQQKDIFAVINYKSLGFTYLAWFLSFHRRQAS